MGHVGRRCIEKEGNTGLCRGVGGWNVGGAYGFHIYGHSFEQLCRKATLCSRNLNRWEPNSPMFSAGEERFIAALILGFDGQEQKAIEELRALLTEAEQDEDKGWILLYEARFLGHLLRVAEARERLATVSKIWGRTPEHDARIAVGQAALYEAEGDPARTLKELERILKEYAGQWNLPELQDPYEEIQETRGRLLVGQDRWEEALPLLEEFSRSERPKAGEFYYNLGYCYFMAEEWDKSAERFEEALTKELHPAFVSAAHYYLGRLEYRKGAFTRAIKEYETAEKHVLAGKSRKVIYGELARSYSKLGMKREADRYLQLMHSSAN
jgi:tetratricopeptide (TPR) repeat protein